MKTTAAAAASACLLALWTLPASALAAGKAPRVGDYGESTPLDLRGAEPVQSAAAGGGGSLVRTFVGLAVVIAVIYGLYWVLRQVKASREERSHGHGLSTVASVPLGPNRALHLVRAGRELVLLGVAEHGVVPIRTYREDEARAAGLLDEVAVVEGRAVAARSRGGREGFPTVRELLEELRRRTVRK